MKKMFIIKSLTENQVTGYVKATVTSKVHQQGTTFNSETLAPRRTNSPK